MPLIDEQIDRLRGNQYLSVFYRTGFSIWVLLSADGDGLYREDGVRNSRESLRILAYAVWLDQRICGIPAIDEQNVGEPEELDSLPLFGRYNHIVQN